MIDTASLTDKIISALKNTFPDRVCFVGLQGSHTRCSVFTGKHTVSRSFYHAYFGSTCKKNAERDTTVSYMVQTWLLYFDDCSVCCRTNKRSN
ncbi:hypothetical protein SAMN04487860_10878 [Ruminococcus flavefaciens]|uniref:Uncharacterized protein n=1 Tax=Ruminococcus flavefaciens TaxID=1265 RepID=A0A1M7KFC7_RUMFL|nr:hypothetical protein SAMN04487860_10878 [Ruminococcus flavefaciens]